MARYLVERTFPEDLGLPISAEGEAAARGIIGRNADVRVTWVHSYVSADKTKTFCIYDDPNPEAIRQAAERSGPIGMDRSSFENDVNRSKERVARNHAATLGSRTDFWATTTEGMPHASDGAGPSTARPAPEKLPLVASSPRP
jgi:hypothetical protein